MRLLEDFAGGRVDGTGAEALDCASAEALVAETQLGSVVAGELGQGRVVDVVLAALLRRGRQDEAIVPRRDAVERAIVRMTGLLSLGVYPSFGELLSNSGQGVFGRADDRRDVAAARALLVLGGGVGYDLR